MPSNMACQRGCSVGSPAASRSSTHSPASSFSCPTLYSQVCTLRPPAAELLTVTRGSRRAPITPPQPRGHGVWPLATVESPAIHIVKGGRLEGSTFATGGGIVLAGGVDSGAPPLAAGAGCSGAPIGNGPLAGTSLRGAAPLAGAASEPDSWAPGAFAPSPATAGSARAPLIVTASGPLLGR